jgi:hypothetical protein
MTVVYKEHRPMFRAEFGGHLNVEIRVRGGIEIPVEILNMTEEGAATFRGPLRVDELCAGGVHEVVLSAPHLTTPIELGARVVHARPDACSGMLTFGALIDEWDERRDLVIPQLRAAFNRRREVRVGLAEGQVMWVRLRRPPSAMHVEAEVVDLSLGGFAVKASLRLANRLNVGDPLFLQARLPGATLQHSLEARVRHVEVNPDPQRACAVLGLETILGPESPPAWSREIQRFVMDRQREIAKRYAETRLRRRS